VDCVSRPLVEHVYVALARGEYLPIVASQAAGSLSSEFTDWQVDSWIVVACRLSKCVVVREDPSGPSLDTSFHWILHASLCADTA
jgi:hypothetical protein